MKIALQSGDYGEHYTGDVKRVRTIPCYEHSALNSA